MEDSPLTVGLRVDVDTWRGTRDGVPALLKIFAERDILASFFFSVGPDNMGRHLWRLLKPRFLIKMLRSNAASLYGWDILLRGTLWPGPIIGRGLSQLIRDTDTAGHEVGFHAWDHHRWQARSERLSRNEMRVEMTQGMDMLKDILGHPVSCSAAAGWKCNDDVLLEKQRFGYAYNSDCRGVSIFRPQVGQTLCSPQIPVTLPTYDEVIGRAGISDENYNAYILNQLKPDALNVYTIHAEVEGIARCELFKQFLQLAAQGKIHFVSLGSLLPPVEDIPAGFIKTANFAGREGGLCQQGIPA